MIDDSTDPRLAPAAAEPPEPLADTGPTVAGQTRQLSPAAITGGFLVFAVALFLWLNGRRTEAAEARFTAVPPAATPSAASPPRLDLPLTPAAAQQPAPFSDLVTRIEAPAPAVARAAATPISGYSAAASAASPSDLAQRRRAPALVVDLGAPDRIVLAQTSTTAAPTALGAAAAGAPAGYDAQGPRLNDSEQFAQRVGEQEPERARATAMRNLSVVIPQGAMIPAVLETAINSDLPGYTRAVVSRDVLSFDGRRVLIPRGSRLIGQYKSAVALGQSRAFIIWTRAIRPDGVSIQIGSPGTDALGRGGLEGDVDRHFFRRFSGSILLSVLNAGVAAIGNRPSTQISIGSPGAAAGLAGAVNGEAIPPTIKVAQGEAVRIFVSRDLDFSGVEAVR